jgi:formylglycine-generating enzyme required for sulfatase activity
MRRSVGAPGATKDGSDDEQPERKVRVDLFALDAFEVMAGRLRRFVEV